MRPRPEPGEILIPAGLNYVLQSVKFALSGRENYNDREDPHCFLREDFFAFPSSPFPGLVLESLLGKWYNSAGREGLLMNVKLEAYLESRDYAAAAENLVSWIRGWFAENGPASPAVIGISGGKDSSTVAALCVRALGRERVFGVLMPNGVQDDIDVARDLVNYLGIRHLEVNIRKSTEAVKETLKDAAQQEELPFTGQMITNLQPRIRMTTLYAVSQCLGGRVSNNCNRSENYVGYSTLFGDAAGDFSPLANLTVAEIRRIGEALGLPAEFRDKVPSDGLCGKTDEDNLGFTYEDLDTYILTGECDDPAVKEKIDRKHAANLFKLRQMPAFEL